MPPQLVDQLGQAMDRAGPAARGMLIRLAEAGPTVLDDAAAVKLAGMLHGLLPPPIRLAVNQKRLAGFLKSNRDLVLGWAGKLGAGG